MRKILVEDFEFNFFLVAKDFKIEIFSDNLNINKSYGTGYKTVANEFISKDEKSELLKNQIVNSKSVLAYFNLLKIYFRKRFKRIPLFALQTICNFMKFNKDNFAEFDKLYPSNIQIVNLNTNESLKLAKGDLILLKAEIENLDLHRKSNQREFAEIVFEYNDCRDEQRKKAYFPVYFDFIKISNDENNIFYEKSSYKVILV
jgi:hypothetical protein